MTRIEICLTCDEPFAPVPRHPMVESGWCPACWDIIIEFNHLWAFGQFPSTPAQRLRAEDV